jgi:hypothetical protein
MVRSGSDACTKHFEVAAAKGDLGKIQLAHGLHFTAEKLDGSTTSECTNTPP